MATKTDRPRVLIEQWLPIAEIGAECMRDTSAAKKPPLNRIHIWWARRPLTVSRAAVLASLLPAYPTDANDVPSWPTRFSKRFPTFDAYKAWFLRLIGIHGDPVAGRRLVEWAKTTGKKIAGNPYGYVRAYTVNPSEEQLDLLYTLLEWTWGTRDVTFCDPMSGGGSIPFESLRYGLNVRANELNPVASVILKATLDFPSRFGVSLLDDIRKYGKAWCERLRRRLEPFYPLSDPGETVFAYLWARTVSCPITGRPVPLAPNWWLRKGANPIALRLVLDEKEKRCRFEIVHGQVACTKAKPDQGTIKRGTAISPWTGEAIDGDYIKCEAKGGRLGRQLCAVGVRKEGAFPFRLPTKADESGYETALEEIHRLTPKWDATGLLPTEPRREGRADWGCEIYGLKTWADAFAPRQLLSICTAVEELTAVVDGLPQDMAPDRRNAIATYLSLVLGKAINYNSTHCFWDYTRNKIAQAFSRHDFAFRYGFCEFDASRNLLPWSLDQVLVAYQELVTLSNVPTGELFGTTGKVAIDRLSVTNGPAQSLSLSDASIVCITVDPPYYDNVMYAECSNYFYVWMKRALGGSFPDLFGTELTNEDDEAVMNPARFKAAGRNRRALATADYENKMMACFKEMNRVLQTGGILTVMFTHKQVAAWDTLGMALLRAGFQIDASWPVHTEAESSLHQAKKNAAASTILLACRKREKSNAPVWWDDLKARVRETARTKAAEFEAQGIKGVDLYISTFGPVLSIISENWPVLTSETDPKTGDPLPLKPGEALDLARQEVVNLRKQGLLLGRSVEFDPVTDWYLMAWDAFKAQEFPADEARKLALALGLDLEQVLVRDKRLVAKKSASVVLNLPAGRRKKGMVDEDAQTFPHLIDALHTAMMIYDEEGSKACQVFVDRQGLRTDSRTKALVQAMMEAIPTTRDKAGKFLRPEMTTLDALRMLFWDDLPAPKEEEPPKLDPQKMLAGFGEEESEDEEGEDEEGEDEE